MENRLYSFDIFDTLITRRVAAPTGIFTVMREILKTPEYESFQESIRMEFYQMRIGAEQVARNTFCVGGIQDVTLEQIYQVLVDTGHITNEQADLLCEIERKIEIEYSIGIKENIAELKRIIAEGERVVLISDMYLDENTIRKMLIKADSVFENIKIYVSSEYKKNKYSGDLYEIVAENENVDYSFWKHYGDNQHSDVDVPVKKGIEAERVSLCDLLPIEREILANKKCSVDIQLSIGASRCIRILEKNDYAYSVGCSIAGPLLYPYASWIVEQCKREKINRLYFVARDGYIIKEIVDEILKTDNVQISTKLIYGSRIAWRLPSLNNVAEDIYSIYKSSYEDRILNINDLAMMLNVEVSFLSTYVSRDNDQIWNVSIVDEIVNSLINNSEFISEYTKVYIEKRELLQGYISEVIDCRDDDYAFVDVAGSGLTIECMAANLGIVNKLKCFYFRMDKSMGNKCKNYVYYPYYVNYFVLLEMLCRAPLGQTIGYQRTEEGIIPIFNNVDKEAIINHGVNSVIEGAAEYTRFMRKYGVENNHQRELVDFYLDYIHNTPDDDIMTFFGDIPNMLTGRERKLALFGPELSDLDIRKIYWYRKKDESVLMFYNGSVYSYSLKRCSSRQKVLLNIYDNFRKIYDDLSGTFIVYGAGKKGQILIQQLYEDISEGITKDINEIYWVDKNYTKYSDLEHKVDSVDMINNIDYRFILVAVADNKIYREICSELISLGVSEEKIIQFLPVEK